MTGGQAPHEVLGVAKDANTLQIVSAYRRLAWHPDRNRENPQAKAYFQEIHLAYTALMKEKSPKRLRQQWNAATHAEKFTPKTAQRRFCGSPASFSRVFFDWRYFGVFVASASQLDCV